MFFRISVLQQIGLFDERFFMYPEDIDITRRIHEKYKTIFYPDVSIIHAHAAASRSNAKMLKIHIINIIKYFRKTGSDGKLIDSNNSTNDFESNTKASLIK